MKIPVIGPKNPNFDDKKKIKIKTASFLGRQMTLESPTAVRVGETFFFVVQCNSFERGLM